MASDWKERLGVVYSTNPEFNYQISSSGDIPQIPPEREDLRVQLDKKQRNGKSVTLVTGFSGKDADLQELAKMLKTKLGVGGSAKNGEILIQGDFRQKVMEILIQKGYKVKRSGG
jgi:translation initiation factor 1